MTTITTQREWSVAQRAHVYAMLRPIIKTTLSYAYLVLFSCAVGAAFAYWF